MFPVRWPKINLTKPPANQHGKHLLIGGTCSFMVVFSIFLFVFKGVDDSKEDMSLFDIPMSLSQLLTLPPEQKRWKMQKVLKKNYGMIQRMDLAKCSNISPT